MQPGGARLPAEYLVGRAAPPVEESWEGEDEEEEVVEAGEAEAEGVERAEQ